jgi:hypothetical protein
VATACACSAAPSTASANPLCTAAGLFSGAVGKACSLATHAGTVVGAGKKLLGGHIGGAVKTLVGGGGSTQSTASAGLGLAAIGAWVLGGAGFALHETSAILSQTTTPKLRSTWFSSTYWRMTAISGVLTLPFLFAAAVQALLRSDLMLLGRAAFCYLPLAILAVSIAAPLTMLLLSASDELSSFVASAAGHAGTQFLGRGAALLAALSVLSGSPFIAFLIGTLTAGAALVLWLELMMREAAIYVIVLMLPVVFAAFVWPARRIWAIRSVEVLLALILSKFAIVAVLSLGGAALAGSGFHDVTRSLAGIVLLVMGCFAPWALLRLVPLAELASGAAGALRAEMRAGTGMPSQIAPANAELSDAKWGNDWASWMMTSMRRQAAGRADAPVPGGPQPDRAPLMELPPGAASSGKEGAPETSGAGSPPDAGSEPHAESRPHTGTEPHAGLDSQIESRTPTEPESHAPVATPGPVAFRPAAGDMHNTRAGTEPELDPALEAVINGDGIVLGRIDAPASPDPASASPDPASASPGPASASPPPPGPDPVTDTDQHDPRPAAQPPEDGRL